MDFYGFYTGKIFNAYQYLGAHPDGHGVTFRTFAPGASRIALIGEFNGWHIELYQYNDEIYCKASFDFSDQEYTAKLPAEISAQVEKLEAEGK